MDEKNKNFLALPDEYASYKKAKVAIMQVPYDKTTTYIHGTSGGPSAIIDASKYMELFDDELNQETFKVGIHTTEPLDCEKLNSEEMVEKVYSSTLELLQAGTFVRGVVAASYAV